MAQDFVQPPKKTNLNAGPWKRKRDPKKLAAFRCYCAGRDAYMRGEPIFAPSWWNDDERKQFRDGWEGARQWVEECHEFNRRMEA
jgi:hypothetical protein